MKEQTYWLGETTRNLFERVSQGISLSSPPRGREGSDLVLNGKIAHRDFDSAVSFAENIGQSINFPSHPMISCLRLPMNAIKLDKVPYYLSRVSPSTDPLKNLINEYENITNRKRGGQEVGNYAYTSYKEGIINHLGYTPLNVPKNTLDTIYSMYMSANRFALAQQDNWEDILRGELSRLTNDANWEVKDLIANKYIKSLPIILMCDKLRDLRTVDHLVDHIVSSSNKETNIISFKSDSIPTKFNEENRPMAIGPRIDLIFSIEASWLNQSKARKFERFYQIGIHFGTIHMDFIQNWINTRSTVENIIYQDRRKAPEHLT